MKNILLAFFTVLLSFPIFGQSNISSLRQLEQAEIASIFTIETRMSLDLNFKISDVYYYSDAKGAHFLVLTKKADEFGDAENTEAIKAHSFIIENKQMEKEWTMKDFIIPMINQSDMYESSISFDTDYLRVQDYDEDGIAEVILVYSTKALNGKDDGRLKILNYHNGKKIAIRHQNGVLDYDRFTQVDKSFYELPKGLIEEVKTIIESLEEKEEVIFPNNWKKSMKQKLLKIR